MENSAVPPGMPPRLRPKIGRNVLSCAGLATAFFVLVTSVLAFLVAETGVVHVPLFSRWYEGPQVARTVHDQDIDGDKLRVLIAQRLQEQVAVNPAGPFAVRVDEGELTGVLEKGITDATRDQAWQPKGMQVAVLPDGLELAGNFGRGPLQVAFVALFEPVVEQGVLHFDLKRAQIGDYHLPVFLALKAMSYILSRDLGNWKLSFGADVLKDLRLHDGYLEVLTGNGT